MENLVENLEKMTVSLDDTFRFNCTQCGKCCINREDIILAPYDVFKASKELQMKPSAFAKEYCRTYIGSNSHFPVVTLKARGNAQRCPLLKNKKCSIHKAKPSVCALFPLGRYISIPSGEYGKSGIEQSKVQYLLQPIDCGDKSKTHTVREWLSDFDIAAEDEAFVRWHQVVAECGVILRELEKHVSAFMMSMIWNVVFNILYLTYKIEDAYMPQFENNAATALDFLKKTEKKFGGKNVE